MTNRDALVVGINTYDNFPNLRAPAADAGKIAQSLEQFGFKVNRFPEKTSKGTRTINPDERVESSSLKRKLSKLFKPETRSQQPDFVLFYFSGHGQRITIGEPEGYLITSEGSSEKEPHGVSFEWLKREMQASCINTLVVWLDCCNSGGMLDFTTTYPVSGQSRDCWIHTASRDFEPAVEQGGTEPHSIFTRALLKGLNSEAIIINEGVINQVINEELKSAKQQPMHYFKGSIITFGPSIAPAVNQTSRNLSEPETYESEQGKGDERSSGECSIDLNNILVYEAHRWITSDIGLDYFKSLKDNSFIKELYDCCLEITLSYPKAMFSKRIALLEYLALPKPQVPQGFSEFAIKSNILSFQIATTYKQMPEQGKELAKKLAINALTAASQVVCRIISNNDSLCQFWANLMIVVPSETLQSSSLFKIAPAEDNIKSADYLWQGCLNTSTRLAVAIETRDEYLGFWLPLNRSSRNPTPGATAAFYTGQGFAIFVDDLPEFGDDLPKSAYQRWKEYIRNMFHQTAFLSLPISTTSSSGDGRQVIAVLNVNIVAPEGDCRRAYHREWLDIAQKESAPFICEAYKALMIFHGSNLL